MNENCFNRIAILISFNFIINKYTQIKQCNLWPEGTNTCGLNKYGCNKEYSSRAALVGFNIQYRSTTHVTRIRTLYANHDL